MSIKLMNQAWETDASGNDLLVLLALCDFSNDEGLSYPSLKTLSGKAKVSKSTLSYILRAYEEIGVIQREKRQRDNKSDASTMYKINNLNFDIKDYKKAYQKARNYTGSVHNANTVNSQCEHGENAENKLNVNTGVFAQCEHLYEPPVINHQEKRITKVIPKKSEKTEFNFKLSKDTHYDNLSEEYKEKLKAKCLLTDGDLTRYEDFVRSLQSKSSYKYANFALVYTAWDRERKYKAFSPETEPALGENWYRVSVGGGNYIAINAKTLETKNGSATNTSEEKEFIFTQKTQTRDVNSVLKGALNATKI